MIVAGIDALQWFSKAQIFVHVQHELAWLTLLLLLQHRYYLAEQAQTKNS